MNLEYGLFQEQTQKLVMTMQMKQAIEILQYSNQELNEYLIQVAETNPLLDVDTLARVSSASALRAAEFSKSRLRSTSLGRTAGERASTHSVLEQMAAYEDTLTDWLESQLNVRNLPNDILRIVNFLVGSLDESGYLRESAETVAEVFQTSVETVEQALSVLQECDPLGIGARTLRECLLLQVSQVPETQRNLVSQVIDAHLDDVATSKLPHIAKRLKVPVEQVQAAVDQIRRLNPRPGLAFQPGRIPYAIPDVVVERVAGEWVVITNESSVSQVKFNAGYREFLRGESLNQRTDGAEAEQYLVSKLQSAKWLVRCLEQRRLTLYRVAEAIVATQQGYFDYGPEALKPLTLRQIAEQLGVHESTVSRAARGKYMQTPRGVVELKYFFSAEVTGELGAVSARSAKHRIQALIRIEDPAQPLSDEVLVAKLIEEGIQISRRTVAKYRESLGIPPSWRRRRFDVGS